MAIIVDKVQKRRDIALSCVDLFSQRSIKDLTISEVAKTAGIGKGTVYEYFTNKDDIVFEILHVLMQVHNEKKTQKLLDAPSTKEKVKLFFDFFYHEDDKKLREVYKEFVAISLTSPSVSMREFQTQCFNTYHAWAQEILLEGVKNGEIVPHAMKLVKGLFAFSEGLFIQSIATSAIDDLQKEINEYIDALFELLEVKK